MIRSLIARHSWIAYLLPLAVFMAVGSLEPTPAAQGQPGQATTFLGLVTIPYSAYPLVYAVKLALTVGAMALVAPVYREFRGRISPLAIGVGLAGGALWIGLCLAGLEARLGQWLGIDWLIRLGQRSEFNPLAAWADQPARAYGFLALRLIGLVLVVPVIEEFFLRGFLMRFVTHQNWTQVPLDGISWGGLVAGTVVPMLMHPAEFLAAAAWFSLVTWLMLRTRNLWDCVVAHLLTNLVLGAYVIGAGDWRWM